MSRLRPILLLLLLSLPALAGAADTPYNRVNLSEHASAQVQNDLMVATLFAQAEGRNTLRLAEQVNRQVREAVERAHATPGIEVHTQDYRTQPIYEKGHVRAWRVTQSIQLQTRDGKRLGKLLGQLQESLKLQSIGYQISEEQQRRYLDQVIRTALERFRKRADLIAQVMGKRHWRLVRLSVNNGGARPVPVMRAKMMAADVAFARKGAGPVSLESGTSRIEAQVNGEIELSN